MNTSKKMLKIINSAIDILRRQQYDGEMYYWIIYYTYLYEKPIKSIDKIIEKIIILLHFIDKNIPPFPLY